MTPILIRYVKIMLSHMNWEPIFLEISVREYRTMQYRFDDMLAFLQAVATGTISAAAQHWRPILGK